MQVWSVRTQREAIAAVPAPLDSLETADVADVGLYFRHAQTDLAFQVWNAGIRRLEPGADPALQDILAMELTAKILTRYELREWSFLF